MTQPPFEIRSNRGVGWNRGVGRFLKRVTCWIVKGFWVRGWSRISVHWKCQRRTGHRVHVRHAAWELSICHNWMMVRWVASRVKSSAGPKAILVVLYRDDVQPTFSADRFADFLNKLQVALEHPLFLLALQVLVHNDVRYEFLVMFARCRPPTLFGLR